MKWFEQKLPGFRIIYLHDPFSCHKCINVMNCEDFSDECLPQPKLDELKRLSKGFESKNSVLEHQQREPYMDPKLLFQRPYEHSAVKSNVLKKKSLRSTHSKSFQVLPMKSFKKNYHEPVKSPQKSVKKKTSVERNARISPVKKLSCTADKKQQDSKVPGKGTLKRRRWFLSKLSHKNDNYEDDLFEDQKFGHFQNLFEDETDNAEKYEELKTPVFPFSISPRESTPSPTYKDCYSPTELSRSRKGAEEYQYRRRRRRKLCFADDKTEAPQSDPHSREADVQKRLEEVARILDQQKERTSDSEDDQYFSDVLDNSSKVAP